MPDEQAEQSFADYKATRLAPTAEEAVKAPPAAPESEQPPAEPPTGKQPNPKLEKRFSELTAKRDAALQEAAKEREAREKLEARLHELEGKPQKPHEQAPPAPEKPNRADFADPFDYAEAVAEHKAQEIAQQRQAQEAEASSKASAKALDDAWMTRLEAARADLPDLHELVASADIDISGIMTQAIKESDVGPQMLYHLAENPELAEKITKLSPLEQAREMGRLEVKLAKPAAPQVQASKAPPPIKPLKGGGGGNESYVNDKGEFTGSFAQYKAQRRAGKIK